MVYKNVSYSMAARSAASKCGLSSGVVTKCGTVMAVLKSQTLLLIS